MKTEIETLVNFMRLVEKLGTVRRDIKNLSGELESDTAHILKLAYLTQLTSPFLRLLVDSLKMLELALVHDLVEAECGDVPLCAQNGDADCKLLKKQNEQAAITRIKQMLPPLLGAKIYDLFVEYENKTSREAQVVYALDKLEASFSACRFGGGDVRYWADGDNGDWYYRCAMNGETPQKKMLELLQEPVLNRLEQMALYKCRQAILRSGITVEGEYSVPHYEPEAETCRMIDFIEEVEKLCLVKRSNILSDDSPETEADHIIKLCYWLMLLTPYLQQPADYGKMMRMALVHNLPAAECGDVTLTAQNTQIQQLKPQREQQAMAKIAAKLPEQKDLDAAALFAEFISQETREAQIVTALDKIEAQLQGSFCRDGDLRYWQTLPRGKWSDQHALILRPLLAELKEPAVSLLEENARNLMSVNFNRREIDLDYTLKNAQ